jgi:4-phytase/acid phosphatase
LIKRLTLAFALSCAPALAQAAPLVMDDAVLLMRHGVRPPTHEPALDPAIAPDAWPAWDVAPGDLTAHGAQAVSLVAAFDRTYFSTLAPPGACPSLTIYADVDERTVKTGHAYAAGFAPDCSITVGHAAAGQDPLFSGLDDETNFDPKAAKTAMLQAAGGSATAPITANAALFQKLQNILAPGGTTFLALPSKISAKSLAKPPKLSGPIAEGSSAAEDFLLEYLNDKPMRDVAWGRASKADIAALLALHPLAYTITARPKIIARATAAALAQRIVTLLTNPPAKVNVLVGHDTNIAELGGLLNLHWSLGGYPTDDPPPGGALVFIRSHDSSTGAVYITAFYRVQTMDQIRNLTPLTLQTPPAIEPLPIPGCGDSPAPTACTLPAFAKLVATTLNRTN